MCVCVCVWVHAPLMTVLGIQMKPAPHPLTATFVRCFMHTKPHCPAFELRKMYISTHSLITGSWGFWRHHFRSEVIGVGFLCVEYAKLSSYQKIFHYPMECGSCFGFSIVNPNTPLYYIYIYIYIYIQVRYFAELWKGDSS